MSRDNFYPSCGRGNIRVRTWEPETSPRGIVQIVHGIAEHVERYDVFAEYLNALGYLVVAQDHMGHGRSWEPSLAKGHFYSGWFAAVDDTYRLTKDTISCYPDLPIVILGHSMGSFITRTLLCRYPDAGLSGCILSGTAWMPEVVLSLGRLTSRAVCRFCGEEHPSQLLQMLMFGGYNRRVEHVRTPFDWLTRDSAVVDAYVKDPNCGFVASAGLVKGLLSGIQYIQQPENLQIMNKSVPVLFAAGGDDPVGNFGVGVQQAAKQFEQVGVQSVQCKIYPMCRHEILNEINKEEIYADIYNWLTDILG